MPRNASNGRVAGQGEPTILKSALKELDVLEDRTAIVVEIIECMPNVFRHRKRIVIDRGHMRSAAAVVTASDLSLGLGLMNMRPEQRHS